MGLNVELDDLQKKIYAFVEAAKGKKKLKEKDIINGISAETGLEKDQVKKSMRAMIEVGVLMYSYGGGASSVEIPGDDYLREKGLIQ